MDVAVFSTKQYDQTTFEASNEAFGHKLAFLESRLSSETVELARGFPAVCAFVNDDLDRTVLKTLAANGSLADRAALCGLQQRRSGCCARSLGLPVVRVPAYSPYAVADHTVGLILSLNRKIHRAFTRVRDGNFALEGLMGFDLNGRTVGIVGTGQIGYRVACALSGFGVRLLGYDIRANPDCEALGLSYVSLDELFATSDIITLHCPLTPDNRHMVNRETLARCKPGMMLINTGRGALVDISAVIEALKSGQLGYLGLDVYEQEESLFFYDRSDEILQDDEFSRLLTFPNVLVTGHQAFFTREALGEIARVTLDNISRLEQAGGVPADFPEARLVVG